MTNDFLLRTFIRQLLTALRRAAARAGALLALSMLLSVPGVALATTYTFDGTSITGCTYSAGNQTYTCPSVTLLNGTDSVVIASGYTVVSTASVSFSYNQSFQMSGSAKLQSSGSISFSSINPSNLNISGGTIVAGTSVTVGVQPITANITAASLTTGGGSSRINGSLTVSGAVNLGSSTTIVGAISAGSLTTNSSNSITGNITSSGAVDLGSGATVTGTISGTTITTGSPVSLTGNVTATTSFSLSSGSTLNGNVTAPQVTLRASPSTVNGNIAASTSLTMESGSTVNGTVTGGSLSMAPSPAVINGNATMTGDVDIGSGDTINGDLVAHNVTTHSSNAYISGNAAVNAITLAYAAKVGKTITCTGSGGSGCNCVTDNSGYGMPAPVCGAPAPPPPTGPDHILITHSGSALTCQPQTVSLTACANAACTSNYSGSVTATLAPGGQSFTFNGTGTGAVSQSVAGNATLSASGTGIGGASTCLNNTSNTNSCSMAFSGVGLDLQVPDHVAETQPATILRVLKQSTTSAACVSALANTSQTVSFKCTYVNPASGSLPVRINNIALGSSATASCSSSPTNVTVQFDASGQASPALLYADVGAMSLTASMTLNGTTLTTSDSFTAAPSAFVVTAATASVTNPAAANGSGSRFTAAGSPFTVKITPVNAAGATTPNFGSESTPESPRWSGSLLAPSGGHYPGLVPTIPATPATSTNNNSTPPQTAGVSTTTGVIFEEVGVLKLDASLANANGYLNKAGFLPVGTLNIGRFYPDHFNTVLLNTSSLMTCASAISCPVNYNSGAGFMAYSKQPFDISVTAYSANNLLTQNYTNSVNPGGFSRAVTISAVDASSGLVNPPASPTGNAMAWKTSAGVASTADFAAVRFLTGVASSAAAGSTSHPEYDFGNSYDNTLPSTAVPAPTTIALRATESAGGDGVTSLRSSGTTEATLSILSGRLQVVNNYGSTTLKMPIKVRAQYWNGTGWVLNPAFPGQTVALGASVTISNCVPKVPGSPSCPTVVTSPAQSLVFGNSSDGAGNASFYLNPMSPAGAADLLVSPLIYLPSTKGRATFGVYRSGPLIYIREVF